MDEKDKETKKEDLDINVAASGDKKDEAQESFINKMKEEIQRDREKQIKQLENLYGMELEDIDFISDSKQALLIETPKVANYFMYAVLVLFFALLAWASLAHVDQNTSGQGKVIPSDQVQLVQSLDGGIVSKLFVRDGDVVKQGQPLIKLDDTRFKAVYNEDYAKYLTLLATVARYQAEIAEANDIDFPEVVRRDAPDLVQSETAIFKSRKETLDRSVSTLTRSFDLSQKELNITKPLVKEQVMSELELLRAERQTNDLGGSINQEKEKYKDDAYKNLKNMLSDLAIIQKGIEASKDKLSRTLIVSPVDGIVKHIEVTTIGQVIEPGKNIMEIVPLNDKLLLEVEIDPKDIGFIKVGDDANIKITAYDYTIYGSLHGKVNFISADTLQEAQGNTEKSYYRVIVSTNQNYLLDNRDKKRRLPIYPGMQATVTMATNKITILQYLIGPIYKTSKEALRESQRL
jgi:adhesin transport system membrane fusion protein